MTNINETRSKKLGPAMVHSSLVSQHGLRDLPEEVAFAMATAIYFTTHNGGKWLGYSGGKDSDMVVVEKFLPMAIGYSKKIDHEHLKMLQRDGIILLSGDNSRFSLRPAFYFFCDQQLQHNAVGNNGDVEQFFDIDLVEKIPVGVRFNGLD